MMAKFNKNNIQKIDAPIEEEVEHAVTEGKDKRRRQGIASQEEQRDRANKMATQGRRGCSIKKICLSITPDNYDFIRILAKQSGRSMTRTINDIITMYREAHQDYYDQIKELNEKNGFWEAEPWNK